ncbi:MULTISPECIES: Nif11-like leader peptide family RiPP precursor [Spiribacter]|uniref:Nif11-like leader peptide family natural product n=1 Tax=Spiribacter aquaticus TaxID=1935996 RepID=A0A557RJR8_9GAMM|nr:MULTISPECIES: Nif11-like leader peptide family RiPP precursor [Spiribacter]KAF0280135.1 hypothetical protein BA897_05315 [Spiribacter roseus]KAF0282886.1 hypothetical protein BA898_06670 [Spiribacter roseus]TVO65336.1 Nif11-like leader peptide family natural product precursor [Spiribacter aquaticus]
MKTETAQAFLNQLAEDTALQTKMARAVEAAPRDGIADAILATANEAGHPITADDMVAIAEAIAQSDELPDDALDTVSGGYDIGFLNAKITSSDVKDFFSNPFQKQYWK